MDTMKGMMESRIMVLKGEKHKKIRKERRESDDKCKRNILRKIKNIARSVKIIPILYLFPESSKENSLHSILLSVTPIHYLSCIVFFYFTP